MSAASRLHAALLIKQASQHINPVLAAISGLVPFGPSLYGSYAGDSPRAGMRMGGRSMAEGIGGGLAGLSAGAVLGALLHKPMLIRIAEGNHELLTNGMKIPERLTTPGGQREFSAILGGLKGTAIGGSLGSMHGAEASASNWNDEHQGILDQLRHRIQG